MEGMELGKLVQLSLEVVITVLLPILFKVLVKFLNEKQAEARASKDFAMFETVVAIVRQLVQAAEMNGLTGAIENIGREKKRWVIDMAEAELARRKINVDLDVLDALVEAQVKEAIKDLEPLFPEQGAA